MIQAANIKVAVRIRPLLQEEARQGHTDSKLEVDQASQTVNVLNDRTNIYKNSQFDYVLNQDASQRKVFDQVGIADLVKQVVDGYHATVFAYGQTGSGKTFTMEGYKYKTNDKGIPQPVIEQGDNEGIVPRSIQLLFDMIKHQSSLQKKKFSVYCSYLQIYKEKIFDLLNKSQLKRLINDGPGLKLKWNKHDHFTVENLYTFECRSPDDVLALYHFGIRNKVVASHNMNNSSSRSHTMLSLTIEQVDAKNPDNVVTSKLQLVDLAGSERQAFTGNQANKESIDINKSLFTLRQVITALTDKKNQGNSNSYIPYRESKLTSLLRQSLGGNSFCLMIACLNPCDMYVDENISTLQYAGKASFISNKPMRNDDPRMRMIEDLKKQNRLLNEELSKANDTIQFLSQITGSNPQAVKQNLGNVLAPQLIKMEQMHEPKRQGSASSAITEKRGGESSERKNLVTDRIIKDKDNIEKFFKDKSETLQNIANIAKPQGIPSAANESKDAITERIIHTVNMMKEVLQSNLSLRETIQKQSEVIDTLNSDIFQLQSENEDLRDRVQILEEYTGKDSYCDVTKLVKEKKVLENRVKHLEETSMNWAQFQATRSNFHQSKEKTNQSQLGLVPKATLNKEWNDDYEPVRCAINSEDVSGNESQVSSQHGQKRKKQEQATSQYQRHVNLKGKNSMPIQNTTTNESSSDRHSDYKIRTVKSLANAYSQQQQNSQQYFNKRQNQAHTTKNTYQNQPSQKFSHNPAMNQTTYERQRNSVGLQNALSGGHFKGNNTQQMHSQGDEAHNHRSSDVHHSKKFTHLNSFAHNQRQVDDRYLNNVIHPKGLQASKVAYGNRERSSQPPQSNPQLRLNRELDKQHSIGKPPRSQEKYSQSSSKKPRGNATAIMQDNSQRERLNASANYVSNNQEDAYSGIQNDSFEDDNPMFYRHNTTDGFEDEDDQQEYYDEESSQPQRRSDVSEAVRQQAKQNAMNIRNESGLGQLDVSLPMIRNGQQV